MRVSVTSRLTAFFAVAAFLVPRGHAQALPTASAPLATSGFNLGLVNGTFHYGASASEVFQTGYLGTAGLLRQTFLSGSLIYATKSEQSPFNAIYSGGVQFSNQSNYGTTTYQSLALSQGYSTRNWTFGVADVVSYLPQSPTVGLSGVPGAGDVGLAPVIGIDLPAQNILTYNSDRIANTVSGNLARRLTARTSLSGNVNYGLIHFFNDLSLDTSQISGTVGLNHTVSPRTTVGINASYSIYNYNTPPLGNASFTTRSLAARAQHQFTRNLSAFASAGPQWINSAQSLGIPSRLTASGSAGVTYTRRFGTFGAAYSRGANGGSGVLPGAISDSLGGTYSRSFGRDWAASANVGYSRTSGLGNAANLGLIGLPTLGTYGGFNSLFAGGQVTRRISQSISAFVSYTGFKQTYGNAGTNVPGSINGVVQSFALGISYYPRSVNLGQF